MSGLPKDLRPIAIVVTLGAIMSILDVTIVNIALDTLHRDLDTSLETVQWVATAYLLSLAAVIPLSGWMAERFGARKVWISAVGCFVLSSALCGLAWSADSLIAFRVLQGAAGGMIMPIGMITIAQAAGPQRMGLVMSVIGVPMLLAPVFGPVIGGALIDLLSWRWIFFVNLPVGIISLVAAWRLLPAGVAEGLSAKAGTALPPLDRLGLVLLSPGVTAIVFALSEFGQEGTLTTVTVWLPLAAGLLAVSAFTVRALRIRYPLVEIRLLRGAGFSAAGATVFLVAASFFASMLLLPLYFQNVRGATPLEAGLLLAPQGLGAALSMNIGGRATDRFGAGRVVPWGLLLTVIGTLPFAFVGADTPYALLVAGLFVRGAGMGAAMMPSQAAAYATLPSSADVPRATPLLNILQRVGGSLGAALVAVLLSAQIANSIGASAAARVSGGGDALSDAARRQIAEPLSSAFGHTFLWVTAAVLLALIPALLLTREEHRARLRAAEMPDGDATRFASGVPA